MREECREGESTACDRCPTSPLNETDDVNDLLLILIRKVQFELDVLELVRFAILCALSQPMETLQTSRVTHQLCSERIDRFGMLALDLVQLIGMSAMKLAERYLEIAVASSRPRCRRRSRLSSRLQLGSKGVDLLLSVALSVDGRRLATFELGGMLALNVIGDLSEIGLRRSHRQLDVFDFPSSLCMTVKSVPSSKKETTHICQLTLKRRDTTIVNRRRRRRQLFRFYRFCLSSPLRLLKIVPRRLQLCFELSHRSLRFPKILPRRLELGRERPPFLRRSGLGFLHVGDAAISLGLHFGGVSGNELFDRGFALLSDVGKLSRECVFAFAATSTVGLVCRVIVLDDKGVALRLVLGCTYGKPCSLIEQ